MPNKKTRGDNSDAKDLSIIVTTHAESILIHRTLASIARATKQLEGKYTHEIILHADNPTPETLAYIQNHAHDTLKDVRVFENSFKDLGASRNFAIAQAKGTYIATIDADDLMSENWLRDALDMLSQQQETTVAHSAVTVEFEGANSLVMKHGEIDRATDTLLSVFANRWNSVIVAPRQLLIEEPYAANSVGFGYEDWHLNCRLIDRGVHNLLVPHTAIFVRRKAANSEWLRQAQSMAVLRANPLLAFDAVRKLSINPFAAMLPRSAPQAAAAPPSLKTLAKRVVMKHPVTHKAARKLKQLFDDQIAVNKEVAVPGWLQKEWRELHTVERQIFPTKELMAHLPTYDTITEDHKLAGALYKAMVDQLHYNSYDYVLFVPWLVKGGADKFAIHYANTIAAYNKDKHVLVIATLPMHSPWADKLHSSVDFLDFGNATKDASDGIKHRLLGHLIENGQATHIHVLNSELGYDFVRLHAKYIQATNRKVIVTSFSQSVDAEGRLFGYSHTHVPQVYDVASLITSDNQRVLDMWQREYGFAAEKLLVHRLPMELSDTNIVREPQHKPLRILWAARIAPEKLPELLAPIGKQVVDIAEIDVFGTAQPGYEKFIENLPPNARYKGGFDNGLLSLPLEQYDALLYTSLFDGMPNTILEAASAKLPIIASAIGGIPEFILDKNTGLLVESEQGVKGYAGAIRELAQDPELGIRLSANAYKKLETDFAPNTYRERIAAMLQRLGY